jgi:DnaK suppressor protein
MEGKRLDYFQEKLLQKQLSLTQMVQRTEGYGRQKDEDTQDVADMAVESYTKEFNFGKSSGDRHILQLIREALDRIKDKSFGTCVNCEEPIGPKRLEAVPWTRLCIQCQGLLEKGLLDE